MNKSIKEFGHIGTGQKTQSRTVYLADGLCPTLCSGMDHGNTIPYVVINDGRKTDKDDRKPI